MTAGRWITLALLLPTTAGAALAGELDEALAAHWQGAWVLLATEVYADCLGCDSINALGGGTVESHGVRRFDPGELGRVREVRVGKQRIDLAVDLAEPLLASSPRAGFVLHQERACAVELRIEVPREAVKTRDTALLNARLEAFLQRFADPDTARSNPSWNRRVRGADPAGEEETRARFEEWRREWARRAVAAAGKVAFEAIPRGVGEGDAEGFSEGVETVDVDAWGACDDLVDLPLPDRLPEATAGNVGSMGKGYVFAYALKLLARLRECGLTERAEPAP